MHASCMPLHLHSMQIFLSVMEVYCERIRDLLADDRDNLQVCGRLWTWHR